MKYRIKTAHGYVQEITSDDNISRKYNIARPLSESTVFDGDDIDPVAELILLNIGNNIETIELIYAKEEI